MSELSEKDRLKNLEKLVLEQSKKGRIVLLGLDGYTSYDIEEFIKQPATGILYDLNRLEENGFTFTKINRVNDYAVALVIRKLKEQIDKLSQRLKEGTG